MTARVTLTPRAGEGEAVLGGWALNVSRGGIRVILEEKVDLGAEFEIALTTESGLDVSRVGRVVWLQEEPDGAVVGLEFLGAAPAVPTPAPPGTEPQSG